MEVLISLSLVMIVLSFLLFIYQQLTLTNNFLNDIQKKNFSIRYLENRLMETLPKALGPDSKSKNFYFFTSEDTSLLFKNQNQSLVFTFDNCVKLDKIFSHRVIGRIYLDPQGRLMLAKWPLPQYWKEGIPPPMKKEVLLENVKSVSFKFYLAPETDWKPLGKTNSVQINGKNIPKDRYGQWDSGWEPNYGRLPELIKMKIELEGDKIEKVVFIFPLPNSPTPIIYRQL